MTFILLLGCVQVVSGEAERGDRVVDDRQQLSCSVVFDELWLPEIFPSAGRVDCVNVRVLISL